MSNDVEASKFLSYVLRHAPESIGLLLDSNGWAAVDELIAKTIASGRILDRPTLEAIVTQSDKKRFTLSPDGTRIRAAQGHSIEVDLALKPSVPPGALYHGTADRFLESIWQSGLVSKKRRHVHLSPDIQTATAVGKRHGRPVVLRVDAARMVDDGIVFWRADNGVWLAEAVPPIYLAMAEED